MNAVFRLRGRCSQCGTRLVGVVGRTVCPRAHCPGPLQSELGRAA